MFDKLLEDSNLFSRVFVLELDLQRRDSESVDRWVYAPSIRKGCFCFAPRSEGHASKPILNSFNLMDAVRSLVAYTKSSKFTDFYSDGELIVIRRDVFKTARNDNDEVKVFVKRFPIVEQHGQSLAKFDSAIYAY